MFVRKDSTWRIHSFSTSLFLFELFLSRIKDALCLFYMEQTKAMSDMDQIRKAQFAPMLIDVLSSANVAIDRCVSTRLNYIAHSIAMQLLSICSLSTSTPLWIAYVSNMLKRKTSHRVERQQQRIAYWQFSSAIYIVQTILSSLYCVSE